MLPGIPSLAEIPIGGLRFRIVHEPEYLGFNDKGIDVFVHGHTHRQRYDVIGRRAIINPGSASKPRGGTGKSVAVVEVSDGIIMAVEFIEL